MPLCFTLSIIHRMEISEEGIQCACVEGRGLGGVWVGGHCTFMINRDSEVGV